MKTYTVIGVYEDNGEAFAHDVQAENEQEAMTIAAVHGNADAQLCIIGAIEGAHTLYPPCEGSQSTAYASDLAKTEAA